MCMALNTETSPQINGFASQESKHIHVGLPGPSEGSVHFISFFLGKNLDKALISCGSLEISMGPLLGTWRDLPAGPLVGFQREKWQELSSGVFFQQRELFLMPL